MSTERREEETLTTLVGGDQAPARIRVFVVDDHEVVRMGLVWLLAREPRFEIVGEASSAHEALNALKETEVDVLIVDHRVVGMSAIDFLQTVARSGLRLKSIVLSASVDDELARAALTAGARGYVVKDASAEDLKEAVRRVARGEIHVDSKIAAHFLAFGGPDSLRALIVTRAELRVLRLAVAGRSNSEIASMTGLSVHTVKSHLSSAYRRLGVGDRSEAAAAAARLGLL